MHSRIFVLREVVDGEQLPDLNNCTCVTEDELADALVPHAADYVHHITDAKEFADDVNWLCIAEECFELSYENNQTFVTLNVSKAFEVLKKKREGFLKCVERLDEKEWCAPYSSLRYEMQELIDDQHGFFIVTVTENSGWWYDTFDSWLRHNCGKFDLSSIAFIKFRVEDTFDYHF